MLGWVACSAWTHRTPALAHTRYGEGVFELTSIVVDRSYRKSVTFKVELRKRVPQEQLCVLGRELATGILLDYPLDHRYSKEIRVSFDPGPVGAGHALHELGRIGMNDEDVEVDGRRSCYMKYRDAP